MDERLSRFILRVVVKKHRTTEWLPVFILTQKSCDYITTRGEALFYLHGSDVGLSEVGEIFNMIRKRKLPSKCSEIIFSELPVAGIGVYSLLPFVQVIRFKEGEPLGLVIHTQ